MMGLPARQPQGIGVTVTWIKTIPFENADEILRAANEGQRALYPREYDTSAFPDQSPGDSIVDAHSLIPGALYHAFATFGVLMAADLPLRRDQHEMIATVVSATNRCQY